MTTSDFPRVHIATDHAGMELSAHLVSHLSAKGYEVVDHGPKVYDALDDYPSFCINAALAVVADQEAGTHALGIVLGGSGNGEQIAANKVKGVRAALAWNLSTAQLAREHNDANVVAVGGRQHSVDEATAHHRGLPGRTLQQRRAPRPPDRQDRHLRAHRRGHRLVPEGHSVHRLARQFGDVFAGERLAVSSPQGRFAQGAALLDGHTLVGSVAHGKHLFLEFEHGLLLHVHLGLYGAWDFGGDATFRGASSIGAPRKVGEREVYDDGGAAEPAAYAGPPAPVGAVRVRLAGAHGWADLRGATTCEAITEAEAAAVLARLGPDPLRNLPGDRDAFSRHGRGQAHAAGGPADGPEGDCRRRERLPGRTAVPAAARPLAARGRTVTGRGPPALGRHRGHDVRRRPRRPDHHHAAAATGPGPGPAHPAASAGTRRRPTSSTGGTG